MIDSHPLDRPVWNALRSRQNCFATGNSKALRMLPAYGHFAAAADLSFESDAALLALVPANDHTWVFETDNRPAPRNAVVRTTENIIQMVACDVATPHADFEYVDLLEDDVGAMRDLARTVKPGPFLDRTQDLGSFVGVKHEGRLVAMAGERLKLTGFTEISAVCTDPDHRGRGLAGSLVQLLANRISDKRETAFLHVFATNYSAICLYKKLGFHPRSMMKLTVLDGGYRS